MDETSTSTRSAGDVDAPLRPPGSRHREEVRLLGTMLVVGPLLALAGLAASPPPQISWPGLLTTAATALALGGLVLVGRPGPAGNLRVLSALTTVIVTAGLIFSRDLAGAPLFYLWPVLPCALVLPRRAVAFQVALAVACHTAAYTFWLPDVGGITPASWLIEATTLAGAAWLVSTLAARLRHTEGRFRSLVQAATDVVLVSDDALVITYASPAVTTLLGYQPEELIGCLVSKVREGPAGAEEAEALRRMTGRLGGSVGPFEAVGLAADGTRRPVEMIVTNLLDDPAVAGFVANVRDLSERKEAEAVLRLRTARSEALAVLAGWAVEASNEMPFLRDGIGLVAETLGAPQAIVALVEDGTLHIATGTGSAGPGPGPDDIAAPLGGLALAGEVLASPAPVVFGPGSPRLGLCTGDDQGSAVAAALRRADGPPFGLICLQWPVPRSLVADELTFLAAAAHTMASAMARHRAYATVAHQARHDALTGLPNRAQLEDVFHHRLAGRLPDETVALLLMDLDRFKDVNDALGHDVGDSVLVEVANRLRHALRSCDIVARLGGDEYAVLAGGLSDAGDAEVLARSVLAALEAPFTIAGVALQLAASVGIALAPAHGHDLTTLLRRSDLAMYEAKGSDDGYRLFRPDGPGDSPADLMLAADLRAAIEQGTLTVAYQPVVDFATGRVAGAEALARWNHPRRGAIPPVEFIPLAEHTGLIRPLTRLVLTEAVAEAGRWRAQGLDLTVAVNLSVHALHDPDLLPTVRAALAASSLPPQSLILELTESAFAHAESVHPIHALHRLGTSLSIDDFGTGYSSVSYLKRLPVSELKVDQSFVQGLAADAQDRHIVGALVQLAHGLGLRVVAEGIEDQAVADACAALGCDFAQGYHFGRPGSPEAVATLAAGGLGRKDPPIPIPMPTPTPAVRT